MVVSKPRLERIQKRAKDAGLAQKTRVPAAIRGAKAAATKANSKPRWRDCRATKAKPQFNRAKTPSEKRARITAQRWPP